jgi:hypothetical protein
MPQRVLALLILVALALGLLNAVPGWVSNVALILLAVACLSLYRRRRA